MPQKKSTDCTNKIINYLEKIKDKCKNTSFCDDCIMLNTDGGCSFVDVIKKLNDELSIEPAWWNIKQIESILEVEE